ncbi:hypothetical protein QQS21_011563 [Conoideocrella luteorostrata]|uniref:Uncharacterized protein n=1 Tax=Conoideocrella luteorostrata TaxID=1105319 RepID=A0AAJ0CHG4_9HYPO|nr:hypothetical protein QQS21_011563 [Conoideocrella luteorostrata]
MTTQPTQRSSSKEFWREAAFCKRMPQGPEDWDQGRVTSEQAVNDLSRALTVRTIAPTSSWEDIFQAHASLTRSVSEEDAEFMKILSIAIGDVAVSNSEMQLKIHGISLAQHKELVAIVNDGIRSCFRQTCPSHKLSDKTIKQYRRGVRIGNQLIYSLCSALGPRAYELPLHVKHSLTTFVSLTKESLLYFKEVEPAMYRPTSSWDSSALSLPNMVYESIGRRLR